LPFVRQENQFFDVLHHLSHWTCEFVHVAVGGAQARTALRNWLDAGILAALDGCEVVIFAGMGQRAAEALKGCGTQIIVTSIGSAEAAISTHLAGRLTPRTEGFCRCSQ
jgi:predicted Fe-Mo cluster-binding NifX family protein